MILLVMGEVAFKKHLKKIEIKPIIKNTNSLLQLIEIDEFIKYLYNSMAYKKTKL
ncbi:hypothetical protein ACFSX9_02070 [Flavobacterium ardleyense]|uniref:Uncharacterized protein n=1 Tax=Flavobacterium ardleyense TaxID=2038737 RepID=A0ABW5Z4E5_9FLAO